MKTDLNNIPRITIITPSFNQGQYLEATIKSVLDQNYPNLEFIIMDGGSKDNSVEVIRRYKKRLTYWESRPDRGQTHAINKGLAMATGDIINWLNSDDLLSPGALRQLAQAWKSRPDTDILFGDYAAVDAGGDLVYTRKVAPYHPAALIWGRQLSSQPAVFFSKKLIDRLGPLDESLTFCMDTEFWSRAALNCAVFKQIRSQLGITRVHGDAKTTRLQHTLKSEHEAILVRTRNLGRLPSRVRSFVFLIMNRFWRLAAALRRAGLRNDFSFFAASRALKVINPTKGVLK